MQWRRRKAYLRSFLFLLRSTRTATHAHRCVVLALRISLACCAFTNPLLAAPHRYPAFFTLMPHEQIASPTQVGAYVKDFHPRMLGLTGTPAQVRRAAKAFRVYFHEVDKDEEESEDYLVDHSIVMYLIGPDGAFIDFYTQLMTASEIADKMIATIAARQPPPAAASGVDRVLQAVGLGKS